MLSYKDDYSGPLGGGVLSLSSILNLNMWGGPYTQETKRSRTEKHMSSIITVIPAKELIESIRANPNDVLCIEKRRVDKMYKGSQFLNVYFKHNGKKVPAYFSFSGFETTIGVADPNDAKDTRNEHKGTRLCVESKLSRAGECGELLSLLNPLWIATAEKHFADGTLFRDGQKIKPLLQTHYSRKCAKEELRGKELEDKKVRLKLDFSTYPQNYPVKFLAGKKKTTIYDYNSRYVTKTGAVQYREAMVDGVPVDESNVHLFINRGSTIHGGRVQLDSACLSGMWYSLPLVASKLIIERGKTGEGYSDDIIEEEGDADADTAASTTTATTPTPQTTEITPDAIGKLIDAARGQQ